jgi:hypothetical protein
MPVVLDPDSVIVHVYYVAAEFVTYPKTSLARAGALLVLENVPQLGRPSTVPLVN